MEKKQITVTDGGWIASNSITGKMVRPDGTVAKPKPSTSERIGQAIGQAIAHITLAFIIGLVLATIWALGLVALNGLIGVIGEEFSQLLGLSSI